MHPYGCVVFIFCNLLKYYFFDKGVCFPFPLLLAVPQYTSLCKCLCIPIYCYSLDKFFMMKLLGNSYTHEYFWCTLPLANLLLIFCHHCQGSILKFVWISFSAPTVFLFRLLPMRCCLRSIALFLISCQVFLSDAFPVSLLAGSFLQP